MKYTTIFLDLDGTLIDSKPGVTKSFSRALSDFGINVPPTGLNAVIGPPLRDSFRTFGLTGERNDDAVARFAFPKHSLCTSSVGKLTFRAVRPIMIETI